MGLSIDQLRQLAEIHDRHVLLAYINGDELKGFLIPQISSIEDVIFYILRGDGIAVEELEDGDEIDSCWNDYIVSDAASNTDEHLLYFYDSDGNCMEQLFEDGDEVDWSKHDFIYIRTEAEYLKEQNKNAKEAQPDVTTPPSADQLKTICDSESQSKILKSSNASELKKHADDEEWDHDWNR
jgi:hypothetical protein